MKMLLIDLATREIFSEIIGWNKSEGSFRTSDEWSKLVYQYKNGLRKLDTPAYKNWENRHLYCISIGIFELEQYT